MSSPLVRRVRSRFAVPTLLLLLTLAAVAQPPTPASYTVLVPVANMHSGPSDDTDMVSQAIYASSVAVLEDKGDWFKIRTADDYTGWVRASVLKKQGGAPYASAGKIFEVWNLSANLYREADVTKHAPLLTVPFETRLEVTNDQVDRSGRWLEVRLPDGRTAYMQSGDVRPERQLLDVSGTVALAKRFLGVTYTWGGSSSFGYDCSGFTQMLMRRRGHVMPRDADLQAAWSGLIAVERQNLQVGDLLYFGSSAEKITHTGMYIGDGQFIHDTTNTHPMVQISKLDDAPWTTLLVAARRLK